MTFCEHCPCKNLGSCRAITNNHPRYCEKVDPEHPDYDPRFIPILLGEEPDRPPATQRVVSFVTAWVSHAAHGFPVVSQDIYAARIAACESCERFNPDRTCQICGCPMDEKATWADQSCPHESPRWIAIPVSQPGGCGCGQKGE